MSKLKYIFIYIYSITQTPLFLFIRERFHSRRRHKLSFFKPVPYKKRIQKSHTRHSKSDHAHNKGAYNKYGDIKLFIYFAVRCGAGALSSAYSHAVHVHSHTTTLPSFPPRGNSVPFWLCMRRIVSSLSVASPKCEAVCVLLGVVCFALSVTTT